MFGRLKAMLGSRSKKAAAAAGLVGVFGVISISTTQVVGPASAEHPVPTGFPTRTSVGPAVDPTIAYEGDCNFGPSDDGTVITSRILNCDADGVRFSAGTYTVTIRESIIHGQMTVLSSDPGDTGADDFPRQPTFIVEDSDIIQTSDTNFQNRAACCGHYTIRRSYLQGFQSSIGAHNNVVVEDSWMETRGTHPHSSGMRVLKNSVIDGNTIICTPVYHFDDGGCSAAGVYYAEALNGGDSAAYNLTITNNYFRRGYTIGGFMDAIGEDNIPDTQVPPGEPEGPYNATRFVDCHLRVDCLDITFTGNVFDMELGGGWNTEGSGEFPMYGNNVWSGNTWTDGQPATPDQHR